MNNSKMNTLLVLIPLAVLFLLLAISHIRIGEALFTKEPITDRLNFSNTTISIHNITQQLTLTIHTSISLKRRLPFISSTGQVAVIYSPHPIDLVYHSRHLLVQAQLTKPVILPLTPSTSPRSSSSTEISLRVHFPSPSFLPVLLQQKSLNISLHVHQLDLRLTHRHLPGWLKNLARISLSDLKLPLTIPIPELPPKWRDNPAGLIQLESYAFYGIQDPTGRKEVEEVGIRATVRVPNPLVELRRWVEEVRLPAMAFQVPLDVLLHDPHHQRGLVPLAFAHSLPLQPLSSHDSSLTLAIEGSLHPSLAAYNGSDSPLTGFLNRFLNGNDNPIRVRYRHQSTGHDAGEKARAMKMKEGGSKRQTPLMMESEEAEQLPRYVEAFLKNLDFGMKFPGRIAGEELVERLGVERMRMSLGGGVLPGRTRLECSGQLWAWVGLPTELAGVGPTLRVSLVRPDVLLLDGPLPSPGSPPPPSSAVPENAFARIHPEAYIPASLAPLNDSSHRLALAAQLRNVPLLPLDNRHQVFRAYAAKYLRHHLPNWKDSPDQQQPSLLTSLIGSFSAHATLASRFHLLLLDVPLSGSFFV